MSLTLQDEKITLIGFGSQGQAWAKNLRESGFEVEVFLRDGSLSTSLVHKEGFSTCSSLGNSKIILLLIPDGAHKDFFRENAHFLSKGASIFYAHGASLCENKWNQIYPHLDHILLAPKAIASELRNQFINKGKLGAVYSVEFSSGDTKESLRNLALKIAAGIGITAGPYEVTFSQETYADLLSEQSLLCGLIPYAAKKCFDFLISKEIPKELAYMEAWHEVKLIGNAMDKLGPEEFFKLISPHAFSGALKAKEKLLPHSFDLALEELYADIETGKFFEESSTESLNDSKIKEKEIWKESEIQKTFETLKSNLT